VVATDAALASTMVTGGIVGLRRKLEMCIKASLGTLEEDSNDQYAKLSAHYSLSLRLGHFR